MACIFRRIGAREGKIQEHLRGVGLDLPGIVGLLSGFPYPLDYAWSLPSDRQKLPATPTNSLLS